MAAADGTDACRASGTSRRGERVPTSEVRARKAHPAFESEMQYVECRFDSVKHQQAVFCGRNLQVG